MQISSGKLYLCFFLLPIVLIACTTTQPDHNIKLAEASRNLGEAYLTQGNNTAALKELLKAKQLAPNDPFIYNDLGLTFMAKERYEIAESYFQKAIALKADYAPARNNLGALYLAQKKWQKAIAIFNTLTDDFLYATPHYPYSNLGWAYYNLKQYPQAIENYKKSLDLKPDYINALHGLGRTYLKIGDTEKALIYLEKAKQINPTFPELLLDLAEGYRRIGNARKAMNTYQMIINLVPQKPIAQTARTAMKSLGYK